MGVEVELGKRRVMTAYCVEDVLVVTDRLLSFLAVTQQGEINLLEKVPERAQQTPQQPVVETREKGVVESTVVFGEWLSPRGPGHHRCDRQLHPLERALTDRFDCRWKETNFEHPAYEYCIEQLGVGVADTGSEKGGQCVMGAIKEYSSTSLPRSHNALQLKAEETGTHLLPGKAQHLGRLRLGREAVARPQIPLPNHVENPLANIGTVEMRDDERVESSHLTWIDDAFH